MKNKKLLLLGGPHLMCDVVLKAKELGIYTIVTDWYTTDKSPAKLTADEYWQESIQDYDKLLQLIKTNKIDGIITGFTDSYLIPYAKLCEKANLPCYANTDLFAKTLDKSMFKQMCRNNGVPVVPEFDQEKFNPSTISPDNKIIIKPVDNSGSRGIIICEDYDRFDDCLNYALCYSEKKQVVIEKYIDMDSISVSYTLQDGVASLSSINDDYIYKVKNTGGVNCGGLYPSKYIDYYLEHIDSKVKEMLRNEGFKNGVLFMQAFTNGNEFYFFEMGYRLSGGRHYIFTENQNKSSSLTQLINYSLTGEMADYIIADRDNPRFKEICYRFNLIGKSGVIKKIEGLEYILRKKEVLFASLLKKEGDEIGSAGTTSTQLLGIYIVVKDKSEIKDIVDDIYRNVRFTDKNGNDLIVRLDY